MKKKLTAMLLAICMVVCLLPVGAFAADGQEAQTDEQSAETLTTERQKQSGALYSGSWEYEKIDNQSVRITGYTGSSRTISIPNMLSGYKVTEIGNYAFENNRMTSLTIPANITWIGYCAFQNCVYLSEIYFNAKNCADCDTYYPRFYNAGSSSNSLKVTFGSGVVRIPSCLFYTNNDTKYAHVTAVSMSNSIKEIGGRAFNNCYDLKTVTWSTAIETIGNYAFSNCISLTSVTIPAPTKSIGYEAFYNCEKLTSISYNARNCADCDSYYPRFYNAGSSSGSLKVTFGSGVLRIPSCLFYTKEGYNYGDGAYAHVTAVTMPNSIKEIGGSAFDHCYDLKTVTWSTAIETIGNYAFSNCISLTSVTIPATTTSIGYEAFYNCEKLTSISYNARNCTDCDSYYPRFYNTGSSSGSLKVTFGSGVVRIPSNLFYTNEGYNYGDGYYAHVTTVTIPSTVKEIGGRAFANCYDLKNVYYSGAQSQWDTISMDDGNDALKTASIHYTAADPTTVSALFTDVQSGQWYTDYVQYVYDKGMMKGTDGGAFGINMKVNRAMVAQILYAKANKPSAPQEQVFSDVKPGAWYYDAVQWAYTNGIVSGVGNGQFAPETNVTREQLALMLYAAQKKPGVSYDISSFADAGSVSSWALDGVKWAVANGMISGKTGNGGLRIDPQGQASRAEAAVVLTGYDKKF